MKEETEERMNKELMDHIQGFLHYRTNFLIKKKRREK